MLREAKTTCTGTFVDCSMYGGYDPVDPCKQTCINPRGGFPDKFTDADTTYDEVDVNTKSLVYHGRVIDVDCKFDGVEDQKICYDKSGARLNLRGKITVKDKYKSHARAPNGAYWKFDCNFIQKFTYQNCWEGDDGKGNECTIWDRILFT